MFPVHRLSETTDRNIELASSASFLLVEKALPYFDFGVRWKRPPGLASSIIQSEPSGASSMSRTLRSISQRSAAVAPPFPSNVMRVSDFDPSPLARADPFHSGNTLPL